MQIQQNLKQNEIGQSDLYRNRVKFTLEGCLGTSIFNLTTGAFLAGFASKLGASDRLNGLLAVIPMIASMIQFISPLILEKIKNRKLIINLFMALHKVLLGTVVFVPLIFRNESLRLMFVFIFIFASFSCVNLIWPGFTSWMTSSVPANLRGKYFGIKDSYALACTTIFSLVMGFILDSFKKPGEAYPEYKGFLVVYILSLVLTLLNIIILTKIKEIPVELSEQKVKLSDFILKPLKNRVFIKVIIFSMLWNAGQSIGIPFLAVYQVKHLQLEYKYIMMLTLLTNCVWIIAVRMWGKFADKYTWVHSAIYSIMALAAANFVWGFIVVKTLFLLPIAFILAGIGWGGINISLFNMPFMFAPEENKTIYLGVNAALGGIMGLFATLLGGEIVSRLDGRLINIGVISISNIQVVLLISALILMTSVLYGAKKLKGLVNDKR